MIRDKQTRANVENLITNTTWAEKEKMGLKNFMNQLHQLTKNEKEGWSYTRSSKSNKSHINGPSNAIEGYPIDTQHQTMDECYSTEYHNHSGGSWQNFGNCGSYAATEVFCHKNHQCVWSCISAQYSESTC